MKKWLSYAPGILLLATVGYSGKFIEHSVAVFGKAHHLTLPNIEYVLWAILVGMAISNIFGKSSFFRIFAPGITTPGFATYEIFLKIGIILLGSRFILVDVLRLGGVSLVMVAIELGMAITLMTWLGKKFGLPPKLISLLAVGSSVCGVSAIIATEGAIDADEKDSSTAIAVILSTGVVALFTFPWIGHLLHLSNSVFGLWAGLGVDNTAEAVATGALYSDAAGKIAVLAKTARNATIGFIVLGYALYWAKKGLAKEIGNKASFLWKKFPKFVLGFLAVSLLASMKALDHNQLTSLANLSRWAFLFTFAGVGLKTNIREMLKQGMRPFAVGLLGEGVIAAMTLGLLILTNKVIGL
jgi:uncharacterized integral membrane protein (TIGR00698 family)